ncbi:MAG: hypothetical protein A2298_01615 [Gammaproteobacteria bacterium RIFOXYB2_FULL_38_6]|nr:MAG: hypothetical protein A2298_01615 [Gammaproteobacteria bacterium RIFOXYB2_FULL_38_6]
MWQHDTNNEVMIENVAGKILKQFNPGFPTYGQVITSDLKNYFASDEDWNVFKLFNEIKTKIMRDDGGFFGGGKLLNFNLSPHDDYLLTAGLGITNTPYPTIDTSKLQSLDGVTLWNVETGKAMQQYFGNAAKTFATLSPDGQYVVAGDEDVNVFVWDAISGKKIFDLWDLTLGKYIGVNPKTGLAEYDAAGLNVKLPKDFGDNTTATFSLKFIDENHYLRFNQDIPSYAILYAVTDPKPLKYLKLSNPWISVDAYERDQSIDTSPQAHVLVAGKQEENGILVYQYNPHTQSLKKTWDSNVGFTNLNAIDAMEWLILLAAVLFAMLFAKEKYFHKIIGLLITAFLSIAVIAGILILIECYHEFMVSAKGLHRLSLLAHLIVYGIKLFTAIYLGVLIKFLTGKCIVWFRK